MFGTVAGPVPTRPDTRAITAVIRIPDLLTARSGRPPGRPARRPRAMAGARAAAGGAGAAAAAARGGERAGAPLAGAPVYFRSFVELQCCGHSRISTKCPAIAAAAAIDGDTRCVRPL